MSIAVDAVNFPRALQCKLEGFGDLKIDHRTIGTRIEQKLAAGCSTEFIALPTPASRGPTVRHGVSRLGTESIEIEYFHIS